MRLVQKKPTVGMFTSSDLHFFLACIISMSFFLLQVNSTYAIGSSTLQSYNCGPGTPTSQNPHCYAINIWNGAPGAFTNIYTNQMHAGSDSLGNDDFVTNEMWLGDAHNWVEGGFISQAGINNGNMTMFWADQRPGQPFYFHQGPALNGSDLGKYGYVEILNTSYHQYGVNIGINITGNSFSGNSIDNGMATTQINIGGEVDGYQGASAPKNGYAVNEWYNPNGGGAFQYQDNIGTSQITDAPWAGLPNSGWTQPPQGNSNSGGLYQTCLSGGSIRC